MTALVALGPLAATPILVLLLMEFGPERSVLFAMYWIVPAIVFAIATPLSRRQGRTLGEATGRAAAWAVSSTVTAFLVLLALSFGVAARARAMTVGASSPRAGASRQSRKDLGSGLDDPHRDPRAPQHASRRRRATGVVPAQLSHLGRAGRVTVATAVDEVTPCLPLAVPWTPIADRCDACL